MKRVPFCFGLMALVLVLCLCLVGCQSNHLINSASTEISAQGSSVTSDMTVNDTGSADSASDSTSSELHTHAFKDTYDHDAVTHWQSCACGEVYTQEHVFNEWVTVQDPTETSSGLKERSCVCGYKETDVLPKVEHVHVFSTEWVNNETAHWVACSCGEKDKLFDHAFSDWKVTVQATDTAEGAKERFCSVCGHVETATIPGTSHVHKFSSSWMSNETSHWKVCSCGEKSSLSTHAYGKWKTVTAAGCTTTGTKKHTCTACGVSETATIPATGHTEVVDPAVAATCSINGKTQGKHCSGCNTVFVPQEIIPAKGHVEVIDPAVAATCSAAGKTEGKHCSTCNDVLVAQRVVSKLPHTEVIEPAVAVTCTTDGKTEGKYCLVCNEVLAVQTVIKAKGHNFSKLRVDLPGWETAGARSLACKQCDKAQSDSILPLSQSLYGYKEFGTHTKGAALQALYRQLYEICDAFSKSSENETDGIIGIADFSHSGLTELEALSVYFTFFEENGQFYWLSNTLAVDETRFNVCIAEDYYRASQRKNFDEDISNMVLATAKLITSDMNDLERALVLHNYILKTINYAYIPGTNNPETATWAHSIVGVSSKGKGVCESYSKTFALLCRLNGVECMPVWGDAGGAHMWNLVKINGAWYFADLTWDDLNVDQAYHFTYFGMSHSRSTAERETYSNEYGPTYCYDLPTVSSTDLQAIELLENGKSKGYYYGLDKAFAAMTNKNADYVLDLLLDYYLIESSTTPAVKSITLDGNLYLWGKEQWIDTSILTFAGDVKLNGNLTVNNLDFRPQKGSVTLDLNGKTLTTGGHFCKANYVLTVSEFGMEGACVHIVSGTKDNPTGKLVINTGYQTEFYSNLCVGTVVGDGGDSNELLLRGNVVIETVKNLGSLRCTPYSEDCNISIGSLECYSCYFSDSGTLTMTVTIGAAKYLVRPGMDGTYLNSILISGESFLKFTGSIEHNIGIIVECDSLEDLIGKTLLRVSNASQAEKIVLEAITQNTQCQLTGLIVSDASGNISLSANRVVDGAYFVKDNELLYAAVFSNAVIPDGIQRIGKGVFAGYPDISEVSLPADVTKLDAGAFSNCISLSVIRFRGTMAQWNAVVKDAGWNANTGNYTVVCTDGTVAK